MKYVEKLKNPKWQKKRLEIFERDNWTCQECGEKNKTLHIHHKQYLRYCDPWDYPNELLTTKCDICHFIQTVIDKVNFNEQDIRYLKNDDSVLQTFRQMLIQ